MLSQEDLQNIKMLFSEDIQELKDKIQNLEHRMDRLEERMDRLEHRMDRLEERMDRMEERMDRLEQKVDRLEERMDNLEQKTDRLEQGMDSLKQKVGHLEQQINGFGDCMDGLIQRIDSLESYMHKKFILIENDLIPKVDALYAGWDFSVKKGEYTKWCEDVERKLDYVEPLVEVTKSNSDKLKRHDEIIKMLLVTA